jgi:tellurite resistance protein TerC
MQRFAYLKVGLAAVLVFVGAKMLIEDVYHVPIAVSLGVIALILSSAIVASLLRTREAPGARGAQTAPAYPAHQGDQQNQPRRAAR